MNDVPISSSHWRFWVARPRLEMRLRNRSSGQQRLLARSLPSADVEEEAGQERDSDRQEQDQQRGVGVGLKDPEHHEEHADRRQERSHRVERALGIGRRPDPRLGG